MMVQGMEKKNYSKYAVVSEYFQATHPINA